MKIVIASTYVPFIRGGGTMIVDSLEAQLLKRGYEVETVKIPLYSAWFELLEQMIAIRCLDLTEAAGNRIDRLITIRYPAYALQHPNKVNWFIHHHRGAYDLWGTEYQDIPNTEFGLKTRRMIMTADTLYIKEAKKTFTNSKVVAERLKKFNNVDADDVLYPPLPESEAFYCGESGDYFLYTARLTPIKRQHLAIEAMRYTTSNFKLVLAGAPDLDSYMVELKVLVAKYRIEHKVKFTGWISDKEKTKLTADAFAVIYIAYDEDSYGYSTLEAFHSSKAVISMTDSGGTDEIIHDGYNGRVVEPTPQALADAMEQLWSNRQRTIELGKNAHESLLKYEITWDHVIESLTT